MNGTGGGSPGFLRREGFQSTRRVFAKDFAVNAVCAYYAEEARKFDIAYDVSLDMPECLPVSEPELCALLRNFLENTADNSCGKEPVWEDERLLSSKHEGFGLGTRVVREMAERCGGTAYCVCVFADFAYCILTKNHICAILIQNKIG